ncbi:MAG: RsfS/YbeB/iojap family protein [Leptospirales bacterium]
MASSEDALSKRASREARLDNHDVTVRETDEETRQRAERMVHFLQEKKVRSIWLLFPGITCAYADFLIFGDIEHERHRDSVLEQLDARFTRKGEPFRFEKGLQWSLVDFDSVVIHLFQGGGRSLYRLEDLFPKAPLFVLQEDGQMKSISPENRPLSSVAEHSEGLFLPAPFRSPGS